ncbi:hypothetical protein BGZ47_005496 [Haplosporangium gracile]|nr:hypothetical protein BGZ47_005496 [Haplosporangium gracile]
MPHCRRNLFETQPELYPPKVEAYMDAIFGAQIVPRITALEAGLHYFLGEPHLQELPYDDVSFVGEDNVTYQLRLFQEKLVLDKARQEYGGDVGIANARRVFAVPGEQDQLPPVGVIRERRNIIREAFLKIGIFAAPELNFVRRFVERSEGDLHQLVNLYGP